MCAVLTLNLCRSAGKAALGKGHFGWFNSDVTFEVGVLAPRCMAGRAELASCLHVQSCGCCVHEQILLVAWAAAGFIWAPPIDAAYTATIASWACGAPFCS